MFSNVANMLMSLCFVLYFRTLVCLPLLQVGQDVVAELTKAMKRRGLDMRVAALVSSFIPNKAEKKTYVPCALKI